MKVSAPRFCLESRLALLLGAAFGLAAVVVVPPTATFDGPSHYFRALQVSEGRIRADRFSQAAVGGDLPRGQVAFVNTLWNSYWVRHDFGALTSWAAFSKECGAMAGENRVEFTNTAIYSPVNYVFQAAGLWVSARLALAPLGAGRMGCLFALAGYLLLVVAAMQRLPRFRRGFLLVALCPLLLVQAASFSTDGINFALPALLLAWTWNLRAAAPVAGRRALIAPLALGLAVALLKPTAFAWLACLCLVPMGYFGSARAKVFALSCFFACAAALWLAWNRPYLDVDVSRWYAPDHPAASLQKAYLFTHPFVFLAALGKFVPTDFVSQWPYFYGDVGGWISSRNFALLRILSILLVPGLLLSSSWQGRSDKAWAIGVSAQSISLLALTALALWLADGKPGMNYIPGLAGRYLSLVYLGLAVAWAEIFHSGFVRIRSAFFLLALFGNAAGSAVILASIGFRVW